MRMKDTLDARASETISDLQCQVDALKAENALLQEIRVFARQISDAFQISSGGDEYTFTGSTNTVDALRDALDRHLWSNI